MLEDIFKFHSNYRSHRASCHSYWSWHSPLAEIKFEYLKPRRSSSSVRHTEWDVSPVVNSHAVLLKLELGQKLKTGRIPLEVNKWIPQWQSVRRIVGGGWQQMENERGWISLSRWSSHMCLSSGIKDRLSLSCMETIIFIHLECCYCFQVSRGGKERKLLFWK